MTSISDYVLGFYDGPHATPKEATEGPIFLGIKNVTSDGRLDFSEIRHVSEQEYPKWTKRVKPEGGDVVFSYEATLHRYALIPDGFEGCLGRRMALIRPNPEKLDSRFLHFYMLSPDWRNQVDANIITGATVNRIPLTKVPNFRVAFPDLPEQKRIAAILSAYDELIENNRRRIILLEKAARQLYKEWFVRLRFPGHEHTKITSGVPEGWECKSISDLCVVGRGGSPRPIQSYVGGTVPWFKIGDATASESPYIFETAEAIIEQGVSKSVFLEIGELILSNSATCGVPNFNAVKGCIHDGWLHFRQLKEITKFHLYFYLLEARERILQGIGEGATQKNLNTDYVGRQTIIFPKGGAILDQFEGFAEGTLLMIESIARHNNTLRKARDLLLPRLMNGSLTV